MSIFKSYQFTDSQWSKITGISRRKIIKYRKGEIEIGKFNQLILDELRQLIENQRVIKRLDNGYVLNQLANHLKVTDEKGKIIYNGLITKPDFIQKLIPSRPKIEPVPFELVEVERVDFDFAKWKKDTCLTVNQIANITGCNVQTVSAWNSGRNGVPLNITLWLRNRYHLEGDDQIHPLMYQHPTVTRGQFASIIGCEALGWVRYERCYVPLPELLHEYITWKVMFNSFTGPSEAPTKEQVKQYRESRHMSKVNAAKVVGVHYMTWIGWENGKSKMKGYLFDLVRFKLGEHPQ